MQRAVNADDKAAAPTVQVRPADHDRALDKTRNHRGDRRADHAHRREAQLAEDEDVVEHQIDEDRRDARLHGQQRLARFAQRARVDLTDGKGQHLQQHHAQIALRVRERRLQIQRLLPLVQKQTDQRFAPAEEDQRKERKSADGDEQLRAEGVAHAFVVALAVELRREDPRAGEPAEDAEVEHEQQLVDDRHTGHRLGADLADHDIVEQTDEIGYQVLNKDRHKHGKELAVKRAVADESAKFHEPPRNKRSRRLFYRSEGKKSIRVFPCPAR